MSKPSTQLLRFGFYFYVLWKFIFTVKGFYVNITVASYILFIISVNCGFQLMGCEQVNLNLTPLYFVNLSGFKPQTLTILLKLSTSPLFGLSYKLAYGFLTSLIHSIAVTTRRVESLVSYM